MTSASSGSARASTCGKTHRGGPGSGQRNGSAPPRRWSSLALTWGVVVDLLNPRWQGELRDADFELIFKRITQGLPIPINTETGNHARDAAAINFYCDHVAGQGVHVRSVRSVFEEGEPIFEASKIRSRSHVQIAVRDLTAIVEIEEAAW